MDRRSFIAGAATAPALATGHAYSEAVQGPIESRYREWLRRNAQACSWDRDLEGEDVDWIDVPRDEALAIPAYGERETAALVLLLFYDGDQVGGCPSQEAYVDRSKRLLAAGKAKNA